jgi:iron complex outermembrane receptor protein
VRNYDGYSAETHLDLPEWNNLAVKIDGIVSKRDGTTDNPMEGQSDFNAVDRSGIHVGVLWSPTDNFEARLDFDEAYDGTTPYYVQLLSKTPTSPALAPLVQVQSDRAEVADIGVPQEDSVGRTQGWALHLSWSPLEDLEVRSISAYRRLKQSQYDNGIGAHAGIFVPNGQFARYSLASLRQDQVSHELQALGSLGDLTYVVGAYYSRPLSAIVRHHARLLAFGKTPLLAPGAAFELLLVAPLEALASYEPALQRSVVEPGNYTIVVGPDSVTASGMATITVAP